MLKVKYFFLAVFLCLFLASCQKELVYQTASDILTNKIWYLEKHVGSSFIRLYTGTATFSFTLESVTSRYRDSDGIVGSYTIAELPAGIWIQVSSTSRIIESYKVTQIEKDHFVAEINKNNDLQVLYFSVRP